jgi:hypothetical protein
MKLITGADLTPTQTEQVLSAFLYRWTTGNSARERVWANISGKPTIPLITDHQWLNEHAFWFINDGSRLALNRKHAEPHYLAD